jgi:type II secretory pathway predicted ATPase ExeA
MKSIFELCIANYRVEQTGSDDPLFPVLGRLIRSSIKRLARAYRERVPVAMLTSHSQFAASYVVDRFLSSLDAQTTIIRIERLFDDPASFLKHIVHSVGSEAGAASLPQLEHAFELFLRCEKMNRRRTILVLRDIDTQGRQVLAQVRFLIELEIANHFGLMVVVTGPANDSSKAMQPELEAISAVAAERIFLTPFVLSETREFIRARFERGAQNGGGVKNAGPRFEVYGIRLIHELGSGVPETVDLLCRKAIEIAAGNDKTTVSTTEVKAAARLLGLMQNTRHKQTPDLAPEQAVPGNGSGQLIVRMRGVPEKTIPLNGSNLLIGRDRLCEICVDDAQVSRLHGLIARSTGGVHYRDLGSTNGSAVNGHAAERRILANNDVIAIGDVRIIYSSKGAAEADYIDLDATNTLKILDLSAFPPLDDGGNGSRKPGKS